MSKSFRLHGLQHIGLPSPSLSPRVCSNSCPLSWWCYLTISSSATLFSFCLQSFPASRPLKDCWECPILPKCSLSPEKKNCPKVFALQSDSHLLKMLIFLRGIRELTETLCCHHHLWIHTNHDEYKWEGAGVLNWSQQTHSSTPDIWQAGLQGDLQGTVGSRWWWRLAPLGTGVSELVFLTETMPAPVSHHRWHIGAARTSLR